jgi:uncharacterized membrane protein YeaQ/YmgE (transglycosylase-associated protein family)
MGWLGTLIVGLIAGLLASWIMKAKTGVFVDLLLGVAGAFIGGLIAQIFTGVPLSGGINLWNILVALGGSILVILIYRLIKRK